MTADGVVDDFRGEVNVTSKGVLLGEGHKALSS
jgi:hypothetical protein